MCMQSFGASVRGPGHRQEQRPNQDAWCHRSLRRGRAIVVSDGMGSKPHAEVGARAACAAALEALDVWLRHPDAPVEILCTLVHVLWRARLPAHISPQDAAATCLLVYVPRSGRGVAAQLGDGLILLREEASLRRLQADPEVFGAETHALGTTRRLSAWTTSWLAPGPVEALLCSDGVANDLLPDRFEALLTWVREALLPRPGQERWRMLKNELEHWPTPGHSDDKTLGYLWRGL